MQDRHHFSPRVNLEPNGLIPRRSLQEEIASRLREEIIEGVWEPGARLHERVLCERVLLAFQVSDQHMSIPEHYISKIAKLYSRVGKISLIKRKLL